METIVFVEFRGAIKDGDDYTDRGSIWINPALVAGFYDHTILIEGNKIRVMETTDEIIERFRTELSDDYFCADGKRRDEND